MYVSMLYKALFHHQCAYPAHIPSLKTLGPFSALACKKEHFSLSDFESIKRENQGSD